MSPLHPKDLQVISCNYSLVEKQASLRVRGKVQKKKKGKSKVVSSLASPLYRHTPGCGRKLLLLQTISIEMVSHKALLHNRNIPKILLVNSNNKNNKNN